MIKRIAVKNFILVDEVEIEFSEGFNVLSGETGAGKSILVGALSLLVGGKSTPAQVRSGASEAYVTGVFCVEDNDICVSWLYKHDIQAQDGEILVRRSIKLSGRGSIYMQSTPVSRADLEEFCSLLFDLHGQHEHQSLFHEAHHRHLLDRYADIEALVKQYAENFVMLSNIQKKRRELAENAEQREQEIEFLQHTIDEIQAAELQEGEVETLEQEKKRVSQYEHIAATLDTVLAALQKSEYAGIAVIANARKLLSQLTTADKSLSVSAERLDNVFFELEDVAAELEKYRQQLVYDPVHLEHLDDRLLLVKQLLRKYGGYVSAVQEHEEKSTLRLQNMLNISSDQSAIEKEYTALEKQVSAQAEQIHQCRTAAAAKLARGICAHLHELALVHASFFVDVQKNTNREGKMLYSQYGIDKVQFRIATNSGEPAQALSRIASGGEISRVMLAIKVVLAQLDDIRSLVFDEIDTGIGGQVAVNMAEHLWKIAQEKQVICITHLATIAVRADNHIVVEKHIEDDRTIIRVRNIGGDERIKEIARMLAGDVHESRSVEHAKALLERYWRGERKDGKS